MAILIKMSIFETQADYKIHMEIYICGSKIKLPEENMDSFIFKGFLIMELNPEDLEEMNEKLTNIKMQKATTIEKYHKER